MYSCKKVVNIRSFCSIVMEIYDKEVFDKKTRLFGRTETPSFFLFGGLFVSQWFKSFNWKLIRLILFSNTYRGHSWFWLLQTHFKKVFFSYKKAGLPLYSIMHCTFKEWIHGEANTKKLVLLSFTLLLITLYVISSWGTWCKEGMFFGSRYSWIITPILAIPFGYVYAKQF